MPSKLGGSLCLLYSWFLLTYCTGSYRISGHYFFTRCLVQMSIRLENNNILQSLGQGTVGHIKFARIVFYFAHLIQMSEIVTFHASTCYDHELVIFQPGQGQFRINLSTVRKRMRHRRPSDIWNLASNQCIQEIKSLLALNSKFGKSS